ncbi:unnamed protein product [Paramecium octaurelia]|uniref:Uncharacterized protein n=1 Tax=Paramecium octaurelia TaxID=43137 RepID=A0A8S1Y8X4_PAROT|nr:unnamed protein product [Paramecium octaurelia]
MTQSLKKELRLKPKQMILRDQKKPQSFYNQFWRDINLMASYILSRELKQYFYDYGCVNNLMLLLNLNWNFIEESQKFTELEYNINRIQYRMETKRKINKTMTWNKFRFELQDCNQLVTSQIHHQIFKHSLMEIIYQLWLSLEYLERLILDKDTIKSFQNIMIKESLNQQFKDSKNAQEWLSQ